ncbi:YkyA family protein [Salibacterium salarium]|nr:YkyA family protein [Salibacterium salarium]
MIVRVNGNEKNDSKEMMEKMTDMDKLEWEEKDVLLHKKKIALISIVLLLLGLSACGSSPAEKVYTHLEEAVALEDEFESQQEPIMELEQKEQELYEEMLSLGVEEMDEIKTLSQEAIGYAKERKEHLEKEKESIEAAFEEYKLGEEQLDNVEGANEEAEAVKKTMNNRYETYQELYKSYQTAIEKDIILYEAFTKEDLTIDDLQAEIDAVNEQYSIVVENRDQFNKYTDEYNQAKDAFYGQTDLEIDDEESNDAEGSD